MATRLADLSVGSTTDFSNHNRVFAYLVAELLVHADDQGVGRLDVGERGLETLSDFLGTADAPPGRQHLVCQARFFGGAYGLEHSRRVRGKINLTQRQVRAQDFLILLSRPGQVI